MTRQTNNRGALGRLGIHITGDTIRALFDSLIITAIFIIVIILSSLGAIVWAVRDFWEWSRPLDFSIGDETFKIADWLFFSTLANWVFGLVFVGGAIALPVLIKKWGNYQYQQGQAEAKGFVNGMQTNVGLTENTLRTTIRIARGEPQLLEARHAEPEYLPEPTWTEG